MLNFLTSDSSSHVTPVLHEVERCSALVSLLGPFVWRLGDCGRSQSVVALMLLDACCLTLPDPLSKASQEVDNKQQIEWATLRHTKLRFAAHASAMLSKTGPASQTEWFRKCEKTLPMVMASRNLTLR